MYQEPAERIRLRRDHDRDRRTPARSITPRTTTSSTSPRTRTATAGSAAPASAARSGSRPLEPALAISRRLVLWDIDGTLVDSVRLGLAAFEDAFEHVTGKPPAEPVPFAGRTDYEIAVDLLERSGIEPHDGLLERFGLELERAMARRAGELRARGRAYPGARECLERLGREPDVGGRC